MSQRVDARGVGSRVAGEAHIPVPEIIDNYNSKQHGELKANWVLCHARSDLSMPGSRDGKDIARCTERAPLYGRVHNMMTFGLSLGARVASAQLTLHPIASITAVAATARPVIDCAQERDGRAATATEL